MGPFKKQNRQHRYFLEQFLFSLTKMSLDEICDEADNLTVTDMALILDHSIIPTGAEHDRYLLRLKEAYTHRPYKAGDILWGKPSYKDLSIAIALEPKVPTEQVDLAVRAFLERVIKTNNRVSPQLFYSCLSRYKKSSNYFAKAVHAAFERHSYLIEYGFEYGQESLLIVTPEAFKKVTFLYSMMPVTDLGTSRSKSIAAGIQRFPEIAEELIVQYEDWIHYYQVLLAMPSIRIPPDLKAIRAIFDYGHDFPQVILDMMPKESEILPENRELCDKIAIFCQQKIAEQT